MGAGTLEGGDMINGPPTALEKLNPPHNSSAPTFFSFSRFDHKNAKPMCKKLQTKTTQGRMNKQKKRGSLLIEIIEFSVVCIW